MGIHYDYKSTRGDKAMKKEAKRKARIEQRRARKSISNPKELGGIIHSLPILVTKLSFLNTFGSTIPELTFVNILNSLETLAS